jgi:hypothetical protein
LHQHESALEVGQTTAIEHAECQLPTFARANQNVAAAAALLDTMHIPSIDGVSEVYQWLKNIVSTTVAEQAESFL